MGRTLVALVTLTLAGPLFAQQQGEGEPPRQGAAAAQRSELEVEWVGAGRSGRRIQTALDQESQLQYVDLPLEELVIRVGELYDIPLVLDREALADAGLKPDLPIDVNVRGISLDSGLVRMLASHRLALTLEGDFLLVTTAEAARENSVLRNYWLPAGSLSGPDAAKLIRQVVDPQLWEERGGEATIGVVTSPEGAAGLVVLATFRTHRKVESLLKSLVSRGQLAIAGERSAKSHANRAHHQLDELGVVKELPEGR